MKRTILTVALVLAAWLPRTSQAASNYAYPTLVTPALLARSSSQSFMVTVCNLHPQKSITLLGYTACSWPGSVSPVCHNPLSSAPTLQPNACLSDVQPAPAGTTAGFGQVEIRRNDEHLAAKFLRVGFYVIDANGAVITAVTDRRAPSKQ